MLFVCYAGVSQAWGDRPTGRKGDRPSLRLTTHSESGRRQVAPLALPSCLLRMFASRGNPEIVAFLAYMDTLGRVTLRALRGIGNRASNCIVRSEVAPVRHAMTNQVPGC